MGFARPENSRLSRKYIYQAKPKQFLMQDIKLCLEVTSSSATWAAKTEKQWQGWALAK